MQNTNMMQNFFNNESKVGLRILAEHLNVSVVSSSKLRSIGQWRYIKVTKVEGWVNCNNTKLFCIGTKLGSIKINLLNVVVQT